MSGFQKESCRRNPSKRLPFQLPCRPNADRSEYIFRVFLLSVLRPRLTSYRKLPNVLSILHDVLLATFSPIQAHVPKFFCVSNVFFLPVQVVSIFAPATKCSSPS